MRFFIDKAILLLLCLIIFFNCFPNLTWITVALLSSFCLCCLQLTIANRPFIILLTVLYFLLSLWLSPLSLFTPAIANELFSWKNKKSAFALAFGFTVVTALFHYPGQILYLVFLNVVSIWLKNQSELQEKTNAEIIRLRDASVENQILLEQKNQAIVENQTAQIYAATLQERNRIAREIHDNVGHLLTRSILQVGALKTINQESALNPHLDSLQETLNQAMTSIRKSVHDLHDNSIDLKAAVQSLLNNIKSFETSLDYSMSSQLPSKIKNAFLAIIKEALNNTIKHSSGSKISLILREHPAFYQLMIEDNGSHVSPNYQAGIGLLNMQERIAALSGVFQINTDNGFRIFITIMKEGLDENYNCG